MEQMERKQIKFEIMKLEGRLYACVCRYGFGLMEGVPIKHAINKYICGMIRTYGVQIRDFFFFFFEFDIKSNSYFKNYISF